MKTAVAVLSFSLCSCAIPAGPEPTGKVLRAGLCIKGKASTYAQPQSTAGYASIGEARIGSETDVIPLKKDIAFGIEWRATGMPSEAQVEYIFRHPLITRPDGKQLEGFEEKVRVLAQDGVVAATDCYELSEAYELVAGRWSIAIAYDGKELVAKTFTIAADK